MYRLTVRVENRIRRQLSFFLIPTCPRISPDEVKNRQREVNETELQHNKNVEDRRPEKKLDGEEDNPVVPI